MAISIIFANNRFYLRSSTTKIIFNIHKAGLLYCFETIANLVKENCTAFLLGIFDVRIPIRVRKHPFHV
jgi:hypothetical protein